MLPPGSSRTAVPSRSDDAAELSRNDDSFFNAFLTSPSQQSAEADKSPLAAKQRSPKRISSAGLKKSSSLSSSFTSGTAASEDKASSPRVTSSEKSVGEFIKSSWTPVTHFDLQPISVCVADDSQNRQESAAVAGLLISTSAADVADTSLSEHVLLGQNQDTHKSIAQLISSPTQDGSRDDPTLDTSASSGHFNSQLSSSILSPEPDDLLGLDDDMQLEGGWNDFSISDVRLSPSADLSEVDGGHVADATAELANQLDDQSVIFQCDAGNVTDQADQDIDKDDEPSTSSIAQDTSSVSSAEVDAKVVKELFSAQGSTKELPSLEGSLEASADELSESNKTVVAEDSDLYCDDTDVDEMQLSGSARSGNQQDESSLSVLNSELCTSSADSSSTVGKELEGADTVCQLVPDTHGDEESAVCGTSPPATSCVKNLLEEAMADNSAHDSTGSTEPVRVESSGNSGHTSADEIDTTTSSDIEIISHASSVNGRAAGTHGARPVDISPTRSSRVPYGMVGGQHRRSDSGSSAQSLQSRTDDDFASPEADHGREYFTRSGRRHFVKPDPG